MCEEGWAGELPSWSSILLNRSIEPVAVAYSESVVLTDRSVVVVDEGSRAAGVEQERRCCLPCWREEDDGRRVRGTAALCSAPAETERGNRSHGGSSREQVLLPACFRFARGEREARALRSLFVGHES